MLMGLCRRSFLHLVVRRIFICSSQYKLLFKILTACTDWIPTHDDTCSLIHAGKKIWKERGATKKLQKDTIAQQKLRHLKTTMKILGSSTNVSDCITFRNNGLKGMRESRRMLHNLRWRLKEVRVGGRDAGGCVYWQLDIPGWRKPVWQCAGGVFDEQCVGCDVTVRRRRSWPEEESCTARAGILSLEFKQQASVNMQTPCIFTEAMRERESLRPR